MSTLSATLSQAATKNAELLTTLNETEDASNSLKTSEANIKDLEAKIVMTDGKIKELHRITEDERKDHLKYKDSIVKRMTYKLGGSKGKATFAAKAEKEEREFLQAWQQENEAKQAREEYEHRLAAAREDCSRLQAEKTKHDAAQQELDSLYDQIFGGSTPEVPGEDQAENAVNDARASAEHVQALHSNEGQALAALNGAKKHISEACRHIADARSHSQGDMFIGSSFFDMMERDALHKAEKAIMMAMRNMDEARRHQPAIEPLHDVNIDAGHIVSDVVFDNIFSDMAQHDRIKASQQECQKTLEQLKTQVQQQQQRVQEAQSAVEKARNRLRESRRVLQDIRADAFQKVSLDCSAQH